VRYFIIALLLIVMTYGVAQAPAGRSWKWAYPVPQGNPVFDIAFRDSIHGWGVGARGEERYDIEWLGDEMHLAAEPSVSSAG